LSALSSVDRLLPAANPEKPNCRNAGFLKTRIISCLSKFRKNFACPKSVLPWPFRRALHLAYLRLVAEHTNPKDRPILPRTRYLQLRDIEGVHPAVLKKLKKIAPEPLVGLRDVKEEAIKNTFEFPRIAVVPIPGRSKYWVWIGIRSYLRLKDIKWSETFPVLNYGLEMSEKRIVDLARADLRLAAIFSGQSAKSDWATAQEWEADTKEICELATPGSRQRPNGKNVYADLRGLNPRRLRADKEMKAPEDAVESAAATDEEEQGTEN
jgi:hypothetical protein